MRKLRTAKDSNGDKIYIFNCPGCDHQHYFNKDWSFDGNFEKPTFSPSLLNYFPNDDSYRCHLFIKDGKIEYLNDCSHKLSGKTIDMEDINV